MGKKVLTRIHREPRFFDFSIFRLKIAIFLKFLFWLSFQAYASESIDIPVSDTLVLGGEFDVSRCLRKTKKYHTFDLHMIFQWIAIYHTVLLFAAKLILLMKYPTQMVITQSKT